MKFQEHLAEEKRKIEEEAKQKREEALSGTGQELLHGTTNSTNKNIGTPAFTTGSGTNTTSNVAAFKNADPNQQPTIIPLDNNLLQPDSLTDFNNDIGQISDNIEETENIEDQQIEEILKNSNEEYPFQEKIHEKVGDVFVIEQQFHTGDQTNTKNE